MLRRSAAAWAGSGLLVGIVLGSLVAAARSARDASRSKMPPNAYEWPDL